MLHGSIPWQLSQLSDLHLLDLADNNFAGTIPTSFSNLSSMQRALSLVQLRKQTNIPIYDVILIYDAQVDIVWKGRNRIFQSAADLMTGIDLSSNSLTGGIPPELTDLRGLRFLNLSRNYLSGSIPEGIGNLTLLESLDLSQNKLSGSIPSSIAYMLDLGSLSLSSNNVSGEIPTGNQLRTLDDPSIYSNNPGLCGWPLGIACTNNLSSTSGIKERHQDLETIWLYYAIVAGVVFGFWLWFGALLFCKSQRFAFFESIDVMQSKVLQKMKHV